MNCKLSRLICLCFAFSPLFETNMHCAERLILSVSLECALCKEKCRFYTNVWVKNTAKSKLCQTLNWNACFITTDIERESDLICCKSESKTNTKQTHGLSILRATHKTHTYYPKNISMESLVLRVSWSRCCCFDATAAAAAAAATLLSLFRGNWDECHEWRSLICMSVVRLLWLFMLMVKEQQEK